MRRAAAILATTCLVACEAAPQVRIEPPQPIPEGSPFEYPIELWEQGAEGETMLLVHVSEVGDVDTVTVDLSSGQPAFDSAAVRGARKLRFSAARQGDRRVPSWTRVPVRFRVDSLSMGTQQGSGNE